MRPAPNSRHNCAQGDDTTLKLQFVTEMAEEDVSQFNLTPTEFSLYFAYYHRITPPGEKLSGGRAREFFLQTGLSPPLLSAIWKQSDIDQDGCLNSAEFPLAMYLIQQSLRGIPLPLYLPQQLHSVYAQVVNPQLPVATDTHLGKCKKAFEAFRQNVGKGVLGGDAARYLLTKSNLTKGQLYHIWKLSDIDEDGHLSFKEFTVAMHLLFIAKLGYFLPVDLDPNTILSPSHHDEIRRVQAEAEHLPSVDPDHIPIQPFSPPTTPLKKAPFFGENPFTGDDFVNLPARRFCEGEFENYYGDPFESVEIFSGPPLLQPDATTVSDVVPGSTLQQFQVNTGSAESVSQESQESQVHSHSSGMDNGEPDSTEQHDYYVLEEPGQIANQAHFSESMTTSKRHDPELSSHESVNLSQTSSMTESGSEKSSPNSRRSGQKMKKNKNSVESLQDVVVTEREEPVLQLAKSVDVIGSREVTPVPEEEPARWVSPGQVQAELEELSRASRKFLEESRNRLEDQQRRNLHVVNGGEAHLGFRMEELKAASRKGLNATIEEIQGDKGEVSEPQQISEVLQEELASVRVEGDMMAHLDNLEAEVWATLEDAENLDARDNSTTSTAESVVVGGASPATCSASIVEPTAESKDSTVATGKVELKRTGSPLSSGKKIKVTSVQVNIRKSGRNEEPKRVKIQSQPVKQVTHYPKSVSVKNQSVVTQELWAQDLQPVRLRRHPEPVSKEVVNEPPAVKMDKTGSLSRKEARRSFM